MRGSSFNGDMVLFFTRPKSQTRRYSCTLPMAVKGKTVIEPFDELRLYMGGSQTLH
jgi:hypothetical protein